MEGLQSNQGSSSAPLDGSSGHSASAGQSGGAPLSGNTGQQQGESKTPGQSAPPPQDGSSTPPWGSTPSTGGGQPQVPSGCTGVVVLALSATALLALLGALIAPHIV